MNNQKAGDHLRLLLLKNKQMNKTLFIEKYIVQLVFLFTISR